jgi:hypothetical protein
MGSLADSDPWPDVSMYGLEIRVRAAEDHLPDVIHTVVNNLVRFLW